MNEPLPLFVRRRKPDWDALSGLLESQAQGTLGLEGLRTLDLLYRQATADLARAQSFYPDSDAHRFLNALCARAYAAIYRPQRDVWGHLRRFFQREFPRAVRREKTNVSLSAGVLVLGLALGITTVALEPEAAMRLIPSSVQESVTAGQLWTDEVARARGLFSTQIALNNVSVMILAYAAGLAFGVGTLLLLFYNGLQIGALVTYCFQHSLGWGLLDFMSAHGPVELTCITLAGAAGLMMGRALLEPGELPRSQALAQRARDGVRLVLGAAPFLAGIALIEGFISPGSHFTLVIKGGIGLGLGLAFWAYLAFAGREPRA